MSSLIESPSATPHRTPTGEMFGYQLDAPGSLSFRSLPVPSTPEDGVLMRTIATSICSTDISFYEGNLFPQQYPVTLGHEYLGRVVEVGRRLSGISVGERIVYWGQSDFGGLAQYQTLRPVFARQSLRDHFFAERDFMDDARAAAVVVPDEIGDDHASLIEPVTGALRSILRNPPEVGDRVLVLGAGPIGIIAGAIFAALYATSGVDATDAVPARTAQASHFFADTAYLPDELAAVPESTYDYVFDCLPPLNVADPAACPRRNAMLALKPGGKYVLYGASQTRQLLDTWLMLSKGLRIVSASFDVRSYPMHMTALVIDKAMELIRRGIVPAAEMVTQRVPFTDAAAVEGVFANYRGTPHLKTVIHHE
ncbi:zinc-dependent alcohol dehydrogenase [Tsukamurella strandjordii]|uniref:zinc-dependent alcohol dehydrogenase n=1 Tax=Tsukamurella strandjordii TaxID=147577 RepID=UPI0031DBA46D